MESKGFAFEERVENLDALTDLTTVTVRKDRRVVDVCSSYQRNIAWLNAVGAAERAQYG